MPSHTSVDNCSQSISLALHFKEATPQSLLAKCIIFKILAWWEAVGEQSLSAGTEQVCHNQKICKKLAKIKNCLNYQMSNLNTWGTIFSLRQPLPWPWINSKNTRGETTDRAVVWRGKKGEVSLPQHASQTGLSKSLRPASASPWGWPQHAPEAGLRQ